LGIVTETINSNQEGFVTNFGIVRDIDTTGDLQGETWVDGDVLWLSDTTAGALTNVEPTTHPVQIGYVTYAHANNGKIFVYLQEGVDELDELHDVSITSVTNNQGLFYDSATSLWKNKSIATVLGYTPANAATNIATTAPLQGGGDLSANRTFSITQSGAASDGYLSSTDWNTFNNKQPAGSYVPTSRLLSINGTQYDLSADRSWSVGTVTSVAALTLGTTGTDLSSSVANGTTTPVITLNVPTASAANRGALSAADWSTFNTKVGSVTASSPLASSGGSTPNLTIQQASGSQNGYLSSTDWTTFNNKQAAGNYITSLTGEATGTGPGATAVTLNNASVTAKVLTGINITGGTVQATDTMLTAFGKLQNQINGLIGSTIYQGTWNASTNTPALASGVGVRGYYYIVSVAGSTNLDGITDWFVGDWAIFDGTAWQQVDNTDAVVSVNGFTGAVSLTTDNIPEGTTNLYYTNARARAALSFVAGSGAYNSTTGVITIPTNNNQITNGANYITLASLSGTAPIQYNSSTGAISITQSGTASNGYLSSTDWNTFNNKQATISLTTTGTSGAATLVGTTLNIPQYQGALTNPVTGTGLLNRVTKFNSNGSTVTYGLIYDDGSSIETNAYTYITKTLIPRQATSYATNFKSLINATAGWIYLGNLVIPQQGYNACITMEAGLGYNAALSQMGYLKLHIRTSNTTPSGGFYFTAFAEQFGYANFIQEIRISENISTNTLGIYVYSNTFIGIGYYKVEGSGIEYTPVETATAPPATYYQVPLAFTVNSSTTINNTLNVNSNLYVAGTSTLSTAIGTYAATITNVHDSSEGLLIRATDNDSSLYLLNLQSSNTTTGQTWVDRFTVAKNGVATLSNLAGTGTRMVVADANGVLSTQAIGSGSITGSITSGYIPVATGSSTIGDSIIRQIGGFININKSASASILFLSNGDISAIDGTYAAFFEPQNGGKTSYFGRENSAGNWVFSSAVTPYSTVIAAYNSTAPIILGHTSAEVWLFNGGNLSLGSSTDAGYKLDVVGTTRIGNLANGSTADSLFLHGKGVTSGGVPYGDYGSIVLSADSSYTSGARRFLITNGYNATRFAIIQSVDSTTTPTLGAAGAVTSGTLIFSISNTGSAEFSVPLIGTTATFGNHLISNSPGGGVNAATFYDRTGAVGAEVDQYGGLNAYSGILNNNGNFSTGSSGTAYVFKSGAVQQFSVSATNMNVVGNITAGASIFTNGGSGAYVALTGNQIYTTGTTLFINYANNQNVNILTNGATGVLTVGTAATFNSTVTSSGFFVNGTRNFFAFGQSRLIAPDGASTLDITVNNGTTNINSNYYGGGGDNSIIIGTYANYTNQLVLKTSGNVLVGTTTDSGFKTDINGTLRAVGTIRSNQGYAYSNGIINVTGGSASWIFLGTISIGQGGHTAVITIEGGSGYNADESQNGSARIFIRTSNGSPNGSGWYYSATLSQMGYNSNVVSSCIMTQTNATTYNVYVNFGPYSGNTYYKVEGSEFTWTASNSNYGATAPTGGQTLTNIFKVISNSTFAGTVVVSSSVTASSFFESSDSRLKQLIKDDHKALGIGSVKARLYLKDGKEEVGYYAQDLENILPSAVSKNDAGFLSLSYTQVHTAKIAIIEDEVTILKRRVAELESKLQK
jgi:hypothetical protein